MKSLKEHLDKKDVQKLLGEVLHQAGRQGSSPAPDLEVLTKVILSRSVLQIWADVHAGSAALACLKLCQLPWHASNLRQAVLFRQTESSPRVKPADSGS